MGKGSSGNVLAALASFFIPGLGQLVQARIASAAFFFGAAMLMYILVITWPIGLLFHLWAIIDAAKFTPKKSDDKLI